MDIEGAAVCVVAASGGYPDRYETGKQITGVDEAEILSQVFHAGTRLENGHLVSDGGRVLGVTSIDGDGNLKEAVSKVYEAISRIQFDGMHYRRDIARRAIG
jgi:phosphoribosylamine--glycine ligase